MDDTDEEGPDTGDEVEFFCRVEAGRFRVVVPFLLAFEPGQRHGTSPQNMHGSSFLGMIGLRPDQLPASSLGIRQEVLRVVRVIASKQFCLM